MMPYDLNESTKTLTLKMDGDVLSTNAPVLSNQIFEVLKSPLVAEAKWVTLHMDLSAAKMIDSTGLNLLISIIRHTKSRGGAVKISITSTNIHRTMLFTRLDRQMEICFVEKNS